MHNHRARNLSAMCAIGLVAILYTLTAWGEEASEVIDEPLVWPRTFEKNGDTVIVYQPQIEDWEDHELLTARAAMEVRPQGAEEGVYGAVYVEAKTAVDADAREVLFSGMEMTRIIFPTVSDEKAVEYEAVVRGTVFPRQSVLISLDRVIAAVERSQEHEDITVNLAPPPIFYRDKPAIMVVFLGKPRMVEIDESSLLYAVNTNWDVFFLPSSKRYYLRNGTYWLTSTTLQGSRWRGAASLPNDMPKLPKDGNWEEVLANVPGEYRPNVPEVIVSKAPAELIVTDGPAEFEIIPETALMYVTNTDSDLFMHNDENGKQYYYLTAGRWFKAEALEGPWQTAMETLPDDFANIPEDHEMSHVSASVPGTDDAEAAIVMASIPQKATVQRDDVTVTVSYEGKPEFVAIDGTEVSYAVNTPYDVFLVDGEYYCCYQGVWFVGPTATGPWMVCDYVPAAIYDIPSDHPKYNVTYVYVYDSTPDTVVVGYTSGYTGQYVAYGTVMFGLGWALADDDYEYWPYYHYYCHPHYFSYGCGARWDYYHGGYVRAGRVYGPYGGAGRWAGYNPHTGTYARGGYRYGPNGSAYATRAYNPYTNRYRASSGGEGPYRSWQRGVARQGDDWVRGHVKSGPGGTSGRLVTSEGTHVRKTRGDDLYVGKDGAVYRRGDDGWQKRDSGGWEDVTRPGAQGGRRAEGRQTTRQTLPQRGTVRSTAPARRSTAPQRSTQRTQRRSTPRYSPAPQRSNYQQLNRDHRSRQLGERRTRQAQSYRRSSSRSSMPSRSRSRPSGGGRRGGGGRRR